MLRRVYFQKSPFLSSCRAPLFWLQEKNFFVLITRKSRERISFVPLGALSIAISQVAVFQQWWVYSSSPSPKVSFSQPELTLKHHSPLWTQLFCVLPHPDTGTSPCTENCYIVQVVCSSSRGGASDGFISFPLFWNERCHGSHLAHSTLH